MIDFTAYLSPMDLEVFKAAGFGKRMELGTNPALLVVDVTYEFTGEVNEPILDSVKKIRTACGEGAWKSVDTIVKVIEKCRKYQIPVIYTKPEDRQISLRILDKKSSRADELHDERLCQIVEKVKPLPADHVFKKVPPSGFIGTNLLAYLISHKIDTLLVTGGTTSGCVRASVVDAFSYGFKVAVVEEGVFDRGEMSHFISLFDMQAKYCNLMSEIETLEYLEKTCTTV